MDLVQLVIIRNLAWASRSDLIGVIRQMDAMILQIIRAS